jgi:hypothetical protein
MRDRNSTVKLYEDRPRGGIHARREIRRMRASERRRVVNVGRRGLSERIEEATPKETERWSWSSLSASWWRRK